MMKILLISASPRKAKSQTLALARRVVEGLGPSTRVETVHLRDLKIDFCIHCQGCHATPMRCPLKDDVHALLEKMLAADGIIIATPNYINQVTGAMKAVMDRSSHFIHCKRLLNKYICAVVTSGSGTDDDLIKDYIRYYAQMSGAQYSGGVSAAGNEIRKRAAEAARLGRNLAADIMKRKVYPAQKKRIDAAIAHFGTIIAANKARWRGEFAYWKEKGWL